MSALPAESAPVAGGTDPERVAAEVLRALRGKRSRPGFSRHLGYRSNVAQRWETGDAWPTAGDFLRISARLRIGVRARLREFFRRDPGWLESAPVGDELASAILRELRGRTPISTLAQRSGHNRFSVARWLSGEAAPRLPQFLRVIQAASGRMVDFVAAFVDPARVPSIAETWRQIRTSRELAYEHPLSHAVLRALELEGYRRGGHADPTFLARALGLDAATVEQARKLLARNGQIRRNRHGWRPTRVAVVDTGADPKRAHALRLRWAREALRRLEAGAPGHCGYSLFAISKADLRRLREIQLAYVREMQNVITASKANECVGLFCSQLLDLGEPANNAFSEDEPTPQHRAQVRTRGAVRAAGDLAVSERPAPR